MKRLNMAMLALSLCCAQGCASFWASERTVLVGGERQMFFPAGSAVPAVSASANTNGWYSLTANEMRALINP